MYGRGVSSDVVTSRTTPAPPLCRPLPPEPRRTENSRTSTGYDFSITSTSVMRVFVMWHCTASVPSQSGPAPEPPAIVS